MWKYTVVLDCMWLFIEEEKWDDLHHVSLGQF